MRNPLFAAVSAVLAAWSVVPSFAVADELGNAKLGVTFAQANCAGCHAVLSGETESPNPDAPAFKAVADTPGITRTALSVFLQSPHPTMPNLIIPAQYADDLIAYILSLKGDGTNAPK
jgi:mono/diheme cytochrome c family protein